MNMLESRQGMLFTTLLRGESIGTLVRFTRAKTLLASRVRRFLEEVHHLKAVSTPKATKEATRLVAVCVLLERQDELEDEMVRQAGDDIAVADKGDDVDDEWSEIKEQLQHAICYLDSEEIYSSAYSHIVKIGLANEVYNVKKKGLNI